MLKAAVLMSLVFSNTALADLGDPTPAQCMQRFAQDYVPEYNAPNDYIVSTDRAAVSGVLDVIKSSGYASWVVAAASAKLTKYVDAVGVVVNYGDEAHLIFTSVNIEGGKCQVVEVADINTVDIEKNPDQTLFSKYFLNLPKNEIPAGALDYVYDEVKNKLAGVEN